MFATSKGPSSGHIAGISTLDLETAMYLNAKLKIGLFSFAQENTFSKMPFDPAVLLTSTTNACDSLYRQIPVN